MAALIQAIRIFKITVNSTIAITNMYALFSIMMRDSNSVEFGVIRLMAARIFQPDARLCCAGALDHQISAPMFNVASPERFELRQDLPGALI